MLLASLLGLSDALTTRPLYATAVLLLVGLAWSIQVVAASTWLTRAVPAPARAGAKGTGEAGMSAAAVLGGLAVAPLLAAGGVRAVTLGVLAATAVLAVAVRSPRSAD